MIKAEEARDSMPIEILMRQVRDKTLARLEQQIVETAKKNEYGCNVYVYEEEWSRVEEILIQLGYHTNTTGRRGIDLEDNRFINEYHVSWRKN